MTDYDQDAWKIEKKVKYINDSDPTTVTFNTTADVDENASNKENYITVKEDASATVFTVYDASSNEDSYW